MEFDALSNQVIGCAIEVHRELGPGLLESTYEQCLAYDLGQTGIGFKLQQALLCAVQGSQVGLRASSNPFVLFVFFVVERIRGTCTNGTE